MSDWHNVNDNLAFDPDALNMPRCDIEELKLKITALESELKEVCDVLIKVSPKHKDWVMSNWSYLYKEQDSE